MDHPTHKLDAYTDSDRKKIVFCRVCSREGDFLAEPCSGKYVSISMREISTYKPVKIEDGDIVGLKPVDKGNENE